MADDRTAAHRVPHGTEGDGRIGLPTPGPDPMIGRGSHRKP
ncbi:hypothetical protein ABZ471_48570 [Streptomyces sp. NPDC005728]